MKLSTSLAIIGAALAGAAVAPYMAHAHSSAVSNKLAEYNQQYNKIVASYDMDAFLALYSSNPLWVAPTDAPVAGLDVPRATFAFIKQKKGVLTHTAEHMFVSLDGSQAVLIGRYDIAIQSVGREGRGTYLFVLQRDGDKWNIVVDMFNEHANEP